MRELDAAGLSVEAAADALADALAAGLDPEAELPRRALAVGPGELLVMPSATATHATVKLVTIGGDPRIQGVCVVFDAATLAPVALVDGVALTNLRTPAVSLLAARYLAPATVREVLVVGRGPQGVAHARALADRYPDAAVTVRGRGDDLAVGAADVICCATTAREPLFAGADVRDDALVIAIGSHEPDAREVDAGLVRRATVVVESRASAAREAGDLILAGADPDLTLADLVAGAPVPRDRPRLFKSTGMSWQDAVVAAAVAARQPGSAAGA